MHLDVDVLAFAGAPLADVPEPFGLTLAELATTVATFAASPRFGGLVLTEINPTTCRTTTPCGASSRCWRPRPAEDNAAHAAHPAGS